jgi:hypothetical protein
VHGSGGSVRWSLAPDAVDEPVERDHLVRLQKQECQNCPLLRSAELEHAPVVAYLEGSEDSEFHAALLS